MIYYPSYLPLPQIDYSFSNNNQTIQTQFESGRITQRSKGTSQRDIANVVFQFNYFQLGVFEAFVQQTLSNGSLAFYIDLPDSMIQASSSKLVFISNGNYQVKALAGSLLWSVSCVLVIQDKDTIIFSETAPVNNAFISISGSLTSNGTTPLTFNDMIEDHINEAGFPYYSATDEACYKDDEFEPWTMNKGSSQWTSTANVATPDLVPAGEWNAITNPDAWKPTSPATGTPVAILTPKTLSPPSRIISGNYLYYYQDDTWNQVALSTLT